MAGNPALIQRVIRESANERHDLIGDLNDWATNMKAKEVASSPELLESFESIPPRSTRISDDCVKEKKDENKQFNKEKIKAYYDAWEKFDVEKACEEVDSGLTPAGNVELSEEEIIRMKALEIKSKAMAAEKKEMGNRHMKEKNYDAAIDCYSKGIDLDKKNSTLYANRAQAYIFKQELNKAKKDCDEALKIDVNYVKVLYRRAKLNVELGCDGEAESDLKRAIKLEPTNREVKNLLNDLQFKRSTSNNSNIASSQPNPIASELSRHILKAKATKFTTVNGKDPLEKMEVDTNASGDSYPKTINPIKKPPQQRSKRPLFPLYVKVLGKKDEQPKKMRVEEDFGAVKPGKSSQCKDSSQLEQLFSKMNFDNLPSKPTTAAQFELHWKQMKSSPEYFAHYIKQMEAEDYNIFQNNMESPMLSDIFDALIWEFIPKKWDIVPHMEGLLKVRRFGTLIMFMNEKDRANARKLVSLCPDVIQSQYLKWNI